MPVPGEIWLVRERLNSHSASCAYGLSGDIGHFLGKIQDSALLRVLQEDNQSRSEEAWSAFEVSMHTCDFFWLSLIAKAVQID